MADTEMRTAIESVRGEILYRLGEIREARQAFREALATSDRITRALAQPRARMLYRGRRRSARQGFLRTLLDDSDARAALQFHQGRNALALNELRAQAQAARRTQEWSVYQEAREDFAHRYRYGCSSDPRGECQIERERLEQQLDAFWSSAWPDTPDQAQGDSETLVLPELPPENVILAAARTPTAWAAFLVRAGQVEVRNDASDPVRPWLDELREARRIYVSPGSSSHAFDLSQRPDPLTGRPLGLDHEVVLVPHLGLRANEAPRAPPSWLVVADPNGDLPAAYRLGANFKARPTTRLLGQSASQAAVLGKWPGARWILFAGHGHTHDRDPWRAHLQLSGQDQLALEDLLLAETRADLVILAGCRTGPQVYRGEIGLPQILLDQGSNSVLATTTLITDATAHRFVRAFIEGGATDDAATAFRRALSEVPHAVSSFRLWGRLPSR